MAHATKPDNRRVRESRVVMGKPPEHGLPLWPSACVVGDFCRNAAGPAPRRRGAVNLANRLASGRALDEPDGVQALILKNARGDQDSTVANRYVVGVVRSSRGLAQPAGRFRSVLEVFGLRSVQASVISSTGHLRPAVDSDALRREEIRGWRADLGRGSPPRSGERDESDEYRLERVRAVAVCHLLRNAASAEGDVEMILADEFHLGRWQFSIPRKRTCTHHHVLRRARRVAPGVSFIRWESY